MLRLIKLPLIFQLLYRNIIAVVEYRAFLSFSPVKLLILTNSRYGTIDIFPYCQRYSEFKTIPNSREPFKECFTPKLLYPKLLNQLSKPRVFEVFKLSFQEDGIADKINKLRLYPKKH